MSPRSRSLWPWVAGLVAATAFFLLLRPAREPVETAAVDRGPLEVTIEEEGETRIEPRYVIAAPVPGRLLAVELREGDPVKRGELLAYLAPAALDPRERARAIANLRAAEAAASEARARAAAAAAALELATSSRERAERLASAGQLSAEALERERTAEATAARDYEAAGHRTSAAACEVDAARAGLLAADGGTGAPRVELCSPIDGRVLRLFERSERTVAAGTPILELGNPAALEVVVELLSTDALAIRPGMPVAIEVGAPAARSGRVRRVEPAAFTKLSPLGVEEQRVRVLVDLDRPAPDLGDRFRVMARIVVWRGEALVRAPAGALFRHGQEWAAFVVEDGVARLRSVGVGRRNPDFAEVLSGLSPGDSVILYPSEKLADGSRVAGIATVR